MIWNARNGKVKIGNAHMDYVTFGKGNKNLVMLPGLGDGLTTVKGMAFPLAITYNIYATDYKVYIFSRKNELEKGFSTREMAKDQAAAMAVLGISRADVIGISQGGMIAQYLAIDHPDCVHKLVLALTSSRPNETIRSTVTAWIQMASQGDYRNLMIDTTEKSYSQKAIRKYRILYPILVRIGKPRNFDRFLIQARSCLNHNAYADLSKISCPVLIIGGRDDKIVGMKSSYEIAEQIKNCTLYIYENFGHAAYEEAEDFNKRILQFLKDR